MEYSNYKQLQQSTKSRCLSEVEDYRWKILSNKIRHFNFENQAQRLKTPLSLGVVNEDLKNAEKHSWDGLIFKLCHCFTKDSELSFNPKANDNTTSLLVFFVLMTSIFHVSKAMFMILEEEVPNTFDHMSYVISFYLWSFKGSCR